jgi:hypothetical protein
MKACNFERAAVRIYPEGIAATSPGLRGTSYPGKPIGAIHNPQPGLRPFRIVTPQPVPGCGCFGISIQGSSFLAPWALCRNPVGILKIPAAVTRLENPASEDVTNCDILSIFSAS